MTNPFHPTSPGGWDIPFARGLCAILPQRRAWNDAGQDCLCGQGRDAMSVHYDDSRRKKSKMPCNSSSIMKERISTVNRHFPGFADAIYTWWHEETEPDVSRED